MRKALVLMMTTCILFAGCIEGLTGDVEEVIEELAPGCNDPTAINYDENDTTATTCITEDALYESIGEFTEKSDSGWNGSQVIVSGIKMTISGVDEEMGMGAYTIVSTTAENENTAYSGTDFTVNGMTMSQSWTVQERGFNLTILNANYMGESFLMHSAMSWDDVSDDRDDSDRDDDDREDDDSEVTQEDCEARGGTWTESGETEGRAGNDSDEGIGDNYTDNGDEHYCDFGDEDDRGDDDSDRDDERDDSDGGMDMELPDPMDFLSMTNGDCDDAAAADSVNPGVCGFHENTEFEVGGDGITVTIPTEEGQSMEMMFDLVTGEMTGLSMDMDDGSHMKLEMLTTEEANALLTIDTTLEYEALPFTLEEAEAEDTDSVFICDNGQEIPADWVNDGMDDCGDNSDEGVEEQEEGPLNRTFTITSDADFDFAGSFEDYSIVLANCVEETDDMGETTLTCDENNSTMYALADSTDAGDSSTEGRDNSTHNAETINADAIADCHDFQIWYDSSGFTMGCFIDSDSSGTLTDGDTIRVTDDPENWTHVRLHSTSADAYSDENPMLTPGFTTILGALSLMGAAMIGRRD